MVPYYYVFKNLPARRQGIVRILALVQGAYYFITGIWPIVHIHSFILVTGPKVDLWLAKLVGLLTVAISFFLLVIAKKMRVTLESIVLILGAGLSYTIMDLVYALGTRISYIYLGDALLQLIFIVVWFRWLVYIKFKLRNYKHY